MQPCLHTPPGRGNCCHCNFILACSLQISVPLAVCCKKFDSYFTFQILWLFLCNCLRKMASIVQTGLSWQCMHSATDKPIQSLAALPSFISHQDAHSLFFSREENRGHSGNTRCTLCSPCSHSTGRGWRSPATTGWAFPAPPAFCTPQHEVCRGSRIPKRPFSRHCAKQGITLHIPSFSIFLCYSV